MTSSFPGRLAIFIAVAALGAAPPIDADEASLVFAEGRQICDRDAGRLWGTSICGPILLVDQTDKSVVASEADPGGQLVADGPRFRGTLPPSVIIANTPTEWSGKRWTQLLSPIPSEAAHRRVLIAHELFHRVQPLLGLTRPEAPNHHLDTLEGRYLVQLEWRALARALQAGKASERRAAIADAIAFRRERYRLFPGAADGEAALELSEGVPEYTGIRLGLQTRREQVAYALRDLKDFAAAPTFVRSFAYAMGPAYGLLLDRADPEWRGKIRAQRFDLLLGAALGINDDGVGITKRAARYDDGSLRASEERREADRQARLAAWKARLVDGPVLVLPLANMRYQFNPQTLVPLEPYGTIYPTMRLTDDWGSLEVERGGALLRTQPRQATVSAVNADPSGSKGDGWQLTLSPGWAIRPGARNGDLVVVCIERCSK